MGVGGPLEGQSDNFTLLGALIDLDWRASRQVKYCLSYQLTWPKSADKKKASYSISPPVPKLAGKVFYPQVLRLGLTNIVIKKVHKNSKLSLFHSHWVLNQTCVARGRAFLTTALKETRRVAPLLTDHPFTSSTTPPRPKEEDYKTRGRDGRGGGANPLNFFSHFKQFLD